ncbi:glycosyltransferase family 61 protein [Ancylobacter amanitiformis]|uniref:Glycosyltransferase 61 catalytic domain-containing protein n=1 Tax=Ancylobacter amanitiformis TaxID=217069 RepID=A0ABU0LUN8_9HYPH|nr:glycosyltransferase family 61 protein [Ancylobacter amanitiformis]MDQ0512387.1 hypothetical protein [Ancylobacter amanitiformis]
MLRSILDAPFLAGTAGELFQLKLRSIAAADAPLGAAGAFAQALGGDASARMQAFGSLYAHAKKTGGIVGEGHPGGPGFIKTSQVRGTPTEPPVEVNHRPVVAIRLDDAWVTGRSGIVRVGDTLLADYHDEELAARPTDYRFDPVLFEQPSGAPAAALLGPQDGPPLDEAIDLIGVTAYNFGHWIVEYVLRLFVLRTQGLADGVPILIDAGLPQSQRDAMALYSEGRHPIIEVGALRTRFVRRLWVPTNLCFVPIMPPAGMPITVHYISPQPAYTAGLCRAMAEAIRPIEGTPRRIFLARKMSLHRKLMNDVEVMDTCRAAGFEVFYPEDHDFHFQVSLCRNAEMIIGPDGSQMLMAMHARPGTRMLILNHPFLENLPTFTHLMEEIGVEAQVLPGTCVRMDEAYRKFSDYTISPDDLRAVFAEWGVVPATTTASPSDTRERGGPTAPTALGRRAAGYRDAAALIRGVLRRLAARTRSG